MVSNKPGEICKLSQKCQKHYNHENWDTKTK